MGHDTDQPQEGDATDLESVRGQVGSIAHDLNNHLTAVMGYTDILYAKLTDDATLREYANMASKSAEVMSELTQKLLVIGGKRRPH